MTVSTSLTAAVAAASLVGVIGLAYAQSAPEGSTQQIQEQNRAAAIGANSNTNIGQMPATNPATMPATMPGTTPMANEPSAMAPNSNATTANTGQGGTTNAMPNPRSDSGMSSNNANSNASDPMTERAARTDRN